jgi:hypothetical protein
MRLICIALLTCSGLAAQQAPQADVYGPRRLPDPKAEAHIQQLIASLPPNSAWRRMMSGGMRGSGIRHAWMDDMRTQGVRLAVLTFEFSWAERGTKLADWQLAEEDYFRDYDHAEAIADPRELGSIEATGLDKELKDGGLAEAKRGFWFELPREDRGRGYRIVYLADDEWLPVNLPPTFGAYPPGTTPLMRAAMLGNVERIKKLLAGGEDVNAASSTGWTALAWAASTGNPASIRALLAAGADVNANPGGTGSALVAAVANDRPDNVRVLLKAGANPNSRNDEGESVLSTATRRHLAEIVRLLKEAGAKE